MKKLLKRILCALLTAVLALTCAPAPFSVTATDAEPQKLFVANVRANSFYVGDEATVRNPGTTPLFVLDGNAATAWVSNTTSAGTDRYFGPSNGSVTPLYLELDLGVKQSVSSIKLYKRTDSDNNPITSVSVWENYRTESGWPGGDLALVKNGTATTTEMRTNPPWADAARAEEFGWSSVTPGSITGISANMNDDKNRTQCVELTLNVPIETRYIRIQPQCDGNISAISEVEVFGGVLKQIARVQPKAVKINNNTQWGYPANDSGDILRDGQTVTFVESSGNSGVIDIDLGAWTEVTRVEVDRRWGANGNRSISKVTASSHTSKDDGFPTANFTVVPNQSNNPNPGALASANDKSWSQTVTVDFASPLQTRYIRLDASTAGDSFSASNVRVFNGTIVPREVDSVSIAPKSAIVAKGKTLTFTAAVSGPASPSQAVIWGVTGNASPDTVINTNGVLTVAANETAPALTVSVMSSVDRSMRDFAAVTVAEPGLVITPKEAVMVRGTIKRFAAQLDGIEVPVTWSVSGNLSAGTAIDSTGLLKIWIDEEAAALTVKADTGAQSVTAAVTVNKYGLFPLKITRFRTQSWSLQGTDTLYPNAINDGDSGTFWHSNYGTGSGSTTKAPYYVDLDLGEVKEITTVELDKRPNASNRHVIREVLAYIHPETGNTYPNGERVTNYFGSATQANINADFADTGWNQLTNLTVTGTSTTANLLTQTVKLTFNEPIKTRYLRLRVTCIDGSGVEYVGVSEIRAIGYTDVPPSMVLTGTAAPPANPLSLWYRKPASNLSLATATVDTLPIGNGKLAALITGTIMTESLQFNEESLWSGGPGGRERDAGNGDGSADYNFGYNTTATNQADLYSRLAAPTGAPTSSPASAITGQIQGNYNGYGKYKNFGWLELDYKFPLGETEVRNYRRELDMNDGISRVTFESGDTTYLREYVASYPDNTIAVRISASGGKSKVNLGITATPGQTDTADGKGKLPVVTAADGVITLSGALRDNGLRYAAVFKVDNTGGSITTTGKTVNVSDADSVTIYFTAGTDYRNEYTSTAVLGAENDQRAFNTLTYRTGESLDGVIARVKSVLTDAMTDAGFSAFKAKHLKDYKNLFDRVSLDIGGVNTIPTDEALKGYATAAQPLSTDRPVAVDKQPTSVGPQHQMLETLMYQYGRYLLIASSREGTLPANLQGKWNNSNTPPWSADYHYNINLQMNYWPAGGGNLLETLEPLQTFMDSLRVTGRYTAQKYSYPANTPANAWKQGEPGWTMHVSGNIYGLTTPGTSWSWGWSPANNVSFAQNLYQYLQYGGDKEIFRRDYWPIIREAAVMWTKALYKSPESSRWAGKYIVVPSYSPEHGPLAIATTYDQQLVWEGLSIVLACIKQLGLENSDAALKAEIEERLANLYTPVEIGTSGTIKEWSEYANNSGVPGAQGEGVHRHMSHMIGFYPGTSVIKGAEINGDNKDYFKAAYDTLAARGLGATGWSMGWKINLWARIKDSANTYQLINNLLSTNTSTNLFDQHPPFQIDGNFGYTAGVHEMLFQSYLGSVDLLPTLPKAWPKGSIKGVRTIGGHELEMAWDKGALTTAKLKAFSDGEIVIRNVSFATASAVRVNGVKKLVTGTSITVNARKDAVYAIEVIKDKQPMEISLNDGQATAEFYNANNAAIAIVFAVYKDRRLVSAASGALESGGAGSLSVDISGGDVVKAYVWGAESFAPLYPAWEVKLVE